MSKANRAGFYASKYAKDTSGTEVIMAIKVINNRKKFTDLLIDYRDNIKEMQRLLEIYLQNHSTTA